MKELLVADAIAAVRKNLDEQGVNDSVMYVDENGDNQSLDLIISKLLPEAINEVNVTASVEELEGTDVTEKIVTQEKNNAIGWQFRIPEDYRYLRLVLFRCDELTEPVSDVIAEASPEGRKQLSEYTRGTYDRPRLVQLQGDVTAPTFRLYSLKGESTTAYNVSSALAQRIINHLTARVLSVYGETAKADNFEKLASQTK